MIAKQQQHRCGIPWTQCPTKRGLPAVFSDLLATGKYILVYCRIAVCDLAGVKHRIGEEYDQYPSRPTNQICLVMPVPPHFGGSEIVYCPSWVPAVNCFDQASNSSSLLRQLTITTLVKGQPSMHASAPKFQVSLYLFEWVTQTKATEPNHRLL